jgi:hypothetical protein
MYTRGKGLNDKSEEPPAGKPFESKICISFEKFSSEMARYKFQLWHNVEAISGRGL